MPRYRVHVGGKRYRHFYSLEMAKDFCEAVFRKTGVILAITESPKKKKG